MKHRHHCIPRSRGGTDEDWNLVELNPYDHAYEHALDFVLFPHAPWFDFRHKAWPLLPENLQKAVLSEASKRQSARIVSAETRIKMSLAAQKRGVPWAGKEHLTEDHKRKIAAALTGKKKSPQHVEKFKKAVRGRKAPNKGIPHSNETKQKISAALRGKPYPESKDRGVNYATVMANLEKIEAWWHQSKNKVNNANGRPLGATVCNRELDLGLTNLHVLRQFLNSLK
jgi:hypothetical protein